MPTKEELIEILYSMTVAMEDAGVDISYFPKEREILDTCAQKILDLIKRNNEYLRIKI